MDVSSFLISAYLFMLLLTLFWRGRELSGPSLFLLRGFFPNWRFYDRPGYQPRLYVRVRRCDGNWTCWAVFMPRGRFRPFSLFHNPLNNLQHANQNLIDHLNSDIKELRDDQLVEQLVTYQLTARPSNLTTRKMGGREYASITKPTETLYYARCALSVAA